MKGQPREQAVQNSLQMFVWVKSFHNGTVAPSIGTKDALGVDHQVSMRVTTVTLACRIKERLGGVCECEIGNVE